jgi:hypothetical protein
MKFIHWSWRVVKRGIWLLGFLPALLDYIAAYVPADYIPENVSTLLETGASPQGSLVLVAIGLLISAFLVHSKTEARLAAYEHQAPEYELKIQEVTSKLCSKDVLHIECNFSMRSLKPWPGYLSRVVVEDDDQVEELTDWEIERVYRLHRNVYVPLSDWPFPVPQSECDFKVMIHSKVNEPVDLRQRAVWKKTMIPLHLLIEYYTQPVGDVQKLIPLGVQVDLSEEFDSIVASHRTETV